MTPKVDKRSCKVNTWPSQAKAGGPSQFNEAIYQANAGITGANTGPF